MLSFPKEAIRDDDDDDDDDNNENDDKMSPGKRMLGLECCSVLI
jgi:hypothetical protein